MSKFAPGEKALLLRGCVCSCGKPDHPNYPAGSIVIVQGVGPFGPGPTMLDGMISFLPARFDYWITLAPDHEGYMVMEADLSKLLDHFDEVTESGTITNEAWESLPA